MQNIRIRSRRQAVTTKYILKPSFHRKSISDVISNAQMCISNPSDDDENIIKTPSDHGNSTDFSDLLQDNLEYYHSNRTNGNYKNLPPLQFRYSPDLKREDLFSKNYSGYRLDKRKYPQAVESYVPERANTPYISHRSYRGNDRRILHAPLIPKAIPCSKRTLSTGSSFQDYIISNIGSRIKNHPINIVKSKIIN